MAEKRNARFRLDYRLGPEDFRALFEATGLRRRFGQPPAWLWHLLGGLNVAMALLRIASIGWDQVLAGWYHWVIAAFAFAAPSLYEAYMRRMARGHPSHGHDIRAEFAETEIVATYADVEERIPYAAIRSVEERAGHLLLWLAARRAVILPRRALAAAGVAPDDVAKAVEGGRMTSGDKSGAVHRERGTAHTPWVRRGEPDPVFEKTVTPVFEDHLAIDFHDGRLLRPLPVVGLATLAGVGIALFLGFDAWRQGEFGTLAILAAAGLAAGIGGGYLFFLLLRWGLGAFFAFGLRSEGRIDKPVRLRFDETGLEADQSGMVTRIPWTNFIDVEKDAKRYFFWISVDQAASIRKDAFADEAERESFEKYLTKWYGRPPRDPPRMARERALPPEVAKEPVKETE